MWEIQFRTIKKGFQKTLETLVNSMEAASGFEPENNGFAGRRLTTWPSRLYHSKIILNLL